MSSWVDIPLGTKSYQPRSGTQSVERLINLYAEPSEPGGKTGVALYGDPGLSLWDTVGDGPCRGLLTATDDSVYAVSGTSLYRFPPGGGSVQLLGTIAGTHICRMVENGTHVLIATENELYYATTADIFVHSLSSFNGVAYQDGYGILSQAGSQNVFITAADDFSSIDALDFTTLDAKPDLVVTCVNNQREVWGLKQKTIEVLANTGAAAFPFTRVSFIERGCISAGSVALADNSVLWLGDDRRVYRSSGYQPVPVSTPAIDRLISEASSHTSAEAFTYTLAGHTHYNLSFPELTLVYNLTTGKWRERRSYGLDRWRAQCHTVRGGTHLVGDYENGNIYELDLGTYEEDGEILEREIVLPPLSDSPNAIAVHELYVDMETGAGLTSGQGSSPVAMLAWSDDDGRTYSNDIEMSVGLIGQYRRRVHATRLGRSTNRTFRIRYTDPTRFSVLGCRARIEVLGP